MTPLATARSISRSIRAHLRRNPPPSLEVLAVFERACDLVSTGEPGRRSVVAVVTPEIGDGPLNIVLDENPWDLATIEPGAPVQTDGERLQIGARVIGLADAAVWEPRPDWARLRARPGAITTRLPMLRAMALEHAPVDSLLALLGEVPCQSRPREVVLSAARSAVVALKAGWSDDMARLREGASLLAGLGAGLTPAGDDFLCGAMLWAWLVHPSASSVCRAIAEAAAPRTTTLSAALLWAAARGECSAAWHALLAALAHGDDAGVAQAAEEVLTRGATSGADALAGFLWAGTQLEFV